MVKRFSPQWGFILFHRVGNNASRVSPWWNYLLLSPLRFMQKSAVLLTWRSNKCAWHPGETPTETDLIDDNNKNSAVFFSQFRTETYLFPYNYSNAFSYHFRTTGIEIQIWWPRIFLTEKNRWENCFYQCSMRQTLFSYHFRYIRYFVPVYETNWKINFPSFLTVVCIASTF